MSASGDTATARARSPRSATGGHWARFAGAAAEEAAAQVGSDMALRSPDTAAAMRRRPVGAAAGHGLSTWAGWETVGSGRCRDTAGMSSFAPALRASRAAAEGAAAAAAACSVSTQPVHRSASP
jgi:hypothetical protein